MALTRSEFLPTAVAVISAVLWGLWWIPIRFLNGIGLEGSVAGLAINVAALPVVLLTVLIWARRWQVSSRGIVGAMLVGLAVTTYATALAYSDVVRVVLLFYLAPAWSTLIECVFMGRRWTWQSAVAMTVSLSGMVLILGGQLSWTAVGAGEVIAIVSGASWSIGAALLFTADRVSTAQTALLTIVTAIATGMIAALAERAGKLPEPEMFAEAGILTMALLAGGVYFAPMIAMTLWSAKLLPPALLSFLLSAEIISGVGSSALMLDEQFGLIELAGTVCIASGAIIEFLLPGRIRKPQDRRPVARE